MGEVELNGAGPCCAGGTVLDIVDVFATLTIRNG